MFNRPAPLFVMLTLMLLSVSCSGLAPAAAPEPTEIPGMRETLIAQGVEATRNAVTLMTLSAPQPTAPLPTAAPPEPTPTSAPTALPELPTAAPALPTTAPALPTAVPTISAGEQKAQAMEADVKKLYDTQKIRSSAGRYHAFPDVNGLTWYDMETTGFIGLNEAPKDLSKYIVRAKVNWRAPGGTEIPERSGCGFVYGYSAFSRYHVSFLAIDGVVHTLRSRGAENIEMKGGPYRGGLGDSADLMLIVEDRNMTFYVNDVQVVTFPDPYLETGRVAPAISTGSVQGMTCTMTDVEMWILD